MVQEAGVSLIAERCLSSDFFDRANTFRDKLPLITEDLQHHASGCYAAVSAVKTQIRRAECELFEAENFGMLVQRRCGRNGATTEAWCPLRCPMVKRCSPLCLPSFLPLRSTISPGLSGR